MPVFKQYVSSLYLTAEAYRMVTSEQFKRLIRKPFKLIKVYDIPYLCGYSKDAKHIYFDRHLKTKMGNVDISPCLITHERTEKALIDAYHLDYQKAHHIALYMEREHVKRIKGITWNAYQKFTMGQLDTIEPEKLTSVPGDLDLTPYKDDKDFSLIRRMKKVD